MKNWDHNLTDRGTKIDCRSRFISRQNAQRGVQQAGFIEPKLSRDVLGSVDFGKSTYRSPKSSLMCEQRVRRPNPYEEPCVCVFP